MSVKVMDLSALNAWVDSLVASHRVLAPQGTQGRFNFEPLASSADLRLDHDVTILPPKKCLLPQREELLQFTHDGAFTSVMDPRPQVLLGVHPYDVAAIGQMDRYFLSDNADEHYAQRRAAAVIVACDVQRPSANVFAGCMGAATVQEGFDLLLTRVGDAYLADPRTAAGEGLLAAAGKLSDATPVQLGRREQLWLDAARLLNRHELRCRTDQLPELLDRSWESPVWAKRAESCYSCGSCVMVCPSCFCFDVRDRVGWDVSCGTRMRQWDGCLLAEFALVAGGHNFRRQRAERYRHRFYRKGKYLPQRLGFVGCVGCGRCVTACTTKIANPVEVYNALLEES